MEYKFYEETWFMWLTLFLFAPIGIFLLWKNGGYNKTKKIVLSAFFGLVFLITIMPSTSQKPEAPQSNSAQAETPTAQTQEPVLELTVESGSELQAAETSSMSEVESESEPQTAETSSMSELEPEEEAGLQISEPVLVPATDSTAELEPETSAEPEPEPVSTTGQETDAVLPAENQTSVSTAIETFEPAADTRDSTERNVYYTKTGKKYHYENPCGNGTYYPCTLLEAQNRGLGPCEKCVLH